MNQQNPQQSPQPQQPQKVKGMTLKELVEMTALPEDKVLNYLKEMEAQEKLYMGKNEKGEDIYHPDSEWLINLEEDVEAIGVNLKKQLDYVGAAKEAEKRRTELEKQQAKIKGKK
ncbi:MAG TPA: hypothetical protein VJA47_03285 [archaeon]|nr:hypothetical protein [archaeon]